MMTLSTETEQAEPPRTEDQPDLSKQLATRYTTAGLLPSPATQVAGASNRVYGSSHSAEKMMFTAPMTSLMMANPAILSAPGASATTNIANEDRLSGIFLGSSFTQLLSSSFNVFREMSNINFGHNTGTTASQPHDSSKPQSQSSSMSDSELQFQLRSDVSVVDSTTSTAESQANLESLHNLPSKAPNRNVDYSTISSSTNHSTIFRLYLR
jgi:hypothetical protein